MTTRKISWSPHSYEFDKSKGMWQESKKLSPYEELELEENDELYENIPIKGVIMDTPLGIFFKDDALNPYKNFEFWLGHTNFDINKQVAEEIMNTPGVEVFQVMTRYRFILGVGNLFPFQDVRAAIQNKLCGTSIDIKSLAARVNSLQLEFQAAEYPEWIIYVFPNGNLEFSWLEKDESNLEEYNNRKALLLEAQNLSKGQLYSHERENPVSITTQE